MLLNKLFTVAHRTHSSEAISAVIDIDPKHEIFSGHFPEMAVVPGVCMVQMIKEVFEMTKGERYVLSAARNIKFLSVLKPGECPRVDALINYSEMLSGSIKLEGSLFFGPVTFFKLAATLTPL